MPRQARLIEPGKLVHVITRFIGGRYLLAGPVERAEYLTRVDKLARRFDAVLLAYALMSTHVHWVLLAGEMHMRLFFQALNTGFAQWLNRRLDRNGPIFIDRYTTIVFDGPNALPLMSYVHGNPCRAGVVDDPGDSDWTSHRIYLGLEAGHDWLRTDLALKLCELQNDYRGREAFAEYVWDHRKDPRSKEMSGGDLKERRRKARVVAGAPVEVGTPTVNEESGVTTPLVARAQVPLRPRWPGSPELVIRHVARRAGVHLGELLSRSRRQPVVKARAAALVAWTRVLGRHAIEMTATLGICSGAGSQLIYGPWASDAETVAIAEAVAADCWKDEET